MSTFTGSPLTGVINGTNQADVFLGEVTGSDIAYGALNAQINAGNGIDTITLMGKASASKGGTGIGYGAYESTINGNNGNDIINISGTANIALSIPGGVTNPANGHIYFLTDPTLGTSWTHAEAQAVAAGGHLVTINDAAEQAWLNNTFNTLVNFGDSSVRESFWIGLYDPQGDNTDEWVSGEPITYTNWADGEPNSSGEQYGELNPLFAPDKWNDRSDFASEIGGRGIVEIVPEQVGNAMAYGAYHTSVNGGNGNDIINISGTNFGIKDSLISGGNGNDTFNVGTGEGIIDGGRGVDRLFVDYFKLDANNKPTNVTVSFDTLGNVLISGMTDNLGNSFDTSMQSNAWTQTIEGIEQFLVNGTAYTASQFVSVFG